MKTVTLISREKDEFPISREAALVSPTLRIMLEGPFKEKEDHIELSSIDSAVLKKVVEYLEYNLEYKGVDKEQEEVPEFEIPTEMALELLLAADYLNV